MRGKRPKGVPFTHIHKYTQGWSVHTNRSAHTDFCRNPGGVSAHSEVLKVSWQRGNYKPWGKGRGANAGQYHIVCCQKLVDEPMHLMGGVRYSWGWDLSSCRSVLFFHKPSPECTRQFINSFVPKLYVNNMVVCLFQGKQILPCEHLKSFFF